MARVSGKVDAMRLPKEIYLCASRDPERAAGSAYSGALELSDGRRTAVKTIYVIANTESVELLVNGKSAGVNSKPESGLDLLVSRGCVRSGQPEGGGQEWGEGCGAAGVDDGWGSGWRSS